MDDMQTMHAMMLDDAYHVERVLAHGPYGVTELVTIDGAGPFVRKKIPLQYARRRLWSTIAECHSPRLPHIEATYELPDWFVVVYDYVDGITLEQYIAECGRLSASEAAHDIAQLCEAVGELHQHGVIHRDITPANIIMASDGLHLIDFGIARERIGGAERTHDTTTLGTWGYAAPEQYGFAATDARSDVYAIGAVLGFMLTGIQPSDKVQYERLLTDDNVVDSRMRAIVERACAFEPSARPANAGALQSLINHTDANNSSTVASFRSDMSAGSSTGLNEHTEHNVHTGSNTKRMHKQLMIWIAAALIVVLAVVGGIAGYAFMHKASNDNSLAGKSGTSSIDRTDSGAGGSSDGNSGSNSETIADNPLELVESGWSAESGYVEYALALHNTDETHAVQFPQVTITGKDSDGSVMFSDTQVFAIVYAGETAYFAGQVGDGDKPASVEFSAEMPSSDDLLDTDGAETFSVRDVKERKVDLGGVTFSGEVVTDRDDDNGKGVYTDDVQVTLVLRDAKGRIVFGRNTSVAKPAQGKAKAFSIETYGLPDYTSYELYAHVY